MSLPQILKCSEASFQLNNDHKCPGDNVTPYVDGLIIL